MELNESLFLSASTARGPHSTAGGSAQPGVFVDAVAGRHATTTAAALLATRQLTWDKHYGWTYDAWVDDPAKVALAGANGRFSLPALARGFSATVAQAAGGAVLALQQPRQLLQPLQPLLAGLGGRQHQHQQHQGHPQASLEGERGPLQQGPYGTER